MKMLLVDDEVLTLDYLESVIDWEEYDINVIGRAFDGLSAIDIIQEDIPDIIMVDIKMPRMDGLELIKWIREHDIDSKIIVLSAFGEFEYAQKALNDGVSGYLLKPVDEEKLEEMINNVIKVIDEEIQKKQNFIKVTRKLDNSKKIVKERLYSKLLYPSVNFEEVSNIIEELDISISDNSYYLVNITIDELLNDIQDNGREHFQLYLDDITEFISLVMKDNFVFMSLAGEWIAICTNVSLETLKETTHKIVECLHVEKKVNSFIAISQCFNDLRDMSKAYFSTRDIINNRFYYNNDSLVIVEDITTDDGNKLYNIDSEELLIEYIKSGMEVKATNLIDKYFANLSIKHINPEFIYSYCFEILVRIKKEIYIDDFKSFMPRNLEQISIMKIKKHNTLNSLKVFLLDILMTIFEARKRYEQDNQIRVISRAKKYIVDNYKNNITLDEIAFEVDMSKNYFSYLFKRETGIGMWDYLTHVRIEKAKELLKESNSKIYEIAYEIGYENSSYFNRMFKKHTGVTPKEYQNKKVENISNK